MLKLWGTSFNEARANCAGNSAATAFARFDPAGFNEARANCAGNFESDLLLVPLVPVLQ